MNHCKKCRVDIADDTSVCPLCENILTKDEEPQINSYPNVRSRIKTMKFIVRLASYVLIVLEGIFLLINHYNPTPVKWSLVTGICILYTIFTLYYSFNRRNGHIRKIYWQAAGAIVMMLVLDAVTGAVGWSVTYGLPCATILLNGILVVCMLVNLQDWQSYLLVQMFALLLSVVSLVLYFVGITEDPVLPWTSFVLSAIIFSFCLSIGNRTAKSELKRRFYI